MKKMTRVILISAIFMTCGLTAKVATENYRAVVSNDERIHKAYELAKKPTKAAVLEAIVDAANAEPDERIRDAVVIEPEKPKVVRIKTKVTASAGVSPITSVMDKKTVNKAEEFIEKVAHPAEIVMEENLDFTTENIPIQELKYETKDIFPTFEELTYKITLPELDSYVDVNDAEERCYFFDINGTGESEGIELNMIVYDNDAFAIIAVPIVGKIWYSGSMGQAWEVRYNSTNIVKLYPDTRTIDYSSLAPFKNSNEPISGNCTIDDDVNIPTYKQVYDFLADVESGKYPLLMGISWCRIA